MRQYKIFALAIQVILVLQTVYGGFERSVQPASVIGRGFSGTALHHFENLWINPAAVNHVTPFRSSMFYSPSPFQLPQLSNFGMMSGFSAGGLSLAVAGQTRGFDLYRESTVSAGIGMVLEEGFSAGVSASLCHLFVSRYGTAYTPVFDVGAMYSIASNVSLGMAVQNLFGAGFGRDDDIPRMLLTGISWSIEERAVVSADIVKEMRYDAEFRSGVEVSLHEHVMVRAGVQGGSAQLFGGLSFFILPFRFDYAVASHSDLGLSHSIGISIE